MRDTALESTGDAPPAGPAVDLAGVLEEGPLTPRRVIVLALVVLALFVDGYDVTIISFIAPAISAGWGLPPAAMGPIFSAGLAGMVLGGLIMGHAADRVGRRPALLLSLALASVAMLGSATAETPAALAAWRFAAGIGIGAVLPVGLVLANEFTPRRSRTTVMAIMLFGFAVGGTGAAGWMVLSFAEDLGWRWVLGAGGVLGLAGTAVLWATLPESLKFLYARGTPAALLAAVRRIAPQARAEVGARFTWTGEAPTRARASLGHLFVGRLAWVTPTLWGAMFSAQIPVYGVMLWTPTLLTQAGRGGGDIILVSVLFSVGSATGALLVSGLVDRFGPRALAILPFGGAPLLAIIAGLGAESPLLVSLIGLSGVSIGGALQGLIILAGQFYPTDIRGGGVGSAIFVSRFGAVLGPFLLSFVVAAGGGFQAVFYACIAPLLASGACIVGLGRLRLAGGAAPGSAARGDPGHP